MSIGLKRVGNKGGGRGLGRKTKKETLSRERMLGKAALISELKEQDVFDIVKTH